MLATRGHERAWLDGWTCERRLHGRRCLAARTGGGRDVAVAFPELAAAMARQPPTDFVVAQIALAGWTRAGQLRRRRDLGRRTDKAAGEVVRE